MDLDRRILVEDGKVARGKKSLHSLSGGVVSPLEDDARVRQVHVMVAVDGAVWSAEVISYFDKARFSTTWEQWRYHLARYSDDETSSPHPFCGMA